jgi:broad specificity phosphatase PhoE
VIRRLLLVRHGVTTWNREGRFQGRLDPPLDPAGVVEGRDLADRLVREIPGELLLVSSPLSRAAQTAAILADALAADGRPLAVRLEPGLVEIGQGEWEGHTHAELKARDPARYQAWASSGGLREPPGAEPVHAAADRAASAVLRLLDETDAPDTACCVAHGGVLRLAAGRLTGMPDEDSWRLDVDNASLSVLSRDDGTWRIERWNDTSHLRDDLRAEDRRGEGSPRAL